MVNGEWSGFALSIERPHELDESLSQDFAFSHQSRQVRRIQQTDPARQLCMGLQLLEGTLSHAKELDEGPALRATKSLGDIRRNGCRAAPHLRRHAERLVLRKR